MGQYWIFVNIDQEEYWGGGKLAEMFLHGDTGDDILMLVLPPALDPELDQIHQQMLRRASRNRAENLGRLNIPIELLAMIFSEMEDLVDVASLCLANSTLWVTGWSRVRELVQCHPARWEGQRMICLGDYARDLPTGLLEPEEMEEFENSRAHPNFWNFVWEWYAERKWYPERPWRRFRDWEEGRAFNLLAYPDVLGFRYLTLPQSYIHDPRWLLCNLSKKEYVRSTAVLSAVGDAIHLGDILFSQICWSTDPSTSMRYEGDIHRGAWAGDRFSIKDIEEFEREYSKVKWTDVSDRVMKEVLAIWRSEYGQHWPAATPKKAEQDAKDALDRQENPEADSDGSKVPSDGATADAEVVEARSEDNEGHAEKNDTNADVLKATEVGEESRRG